MVYSFTASSNQVAFMELIKILKLNHRKVGPRGLGTLEFKLPIALEVINPRNRVIDSPITNPLYSYIEGLWIVMGEDHYDRIIHYSKFPSQFVDQFGRLEGAYGPRLFGLDQIVRHCYERLVADKDSRRAVVNIYNSVLDWNNASLDIPCTLSFQFLVRDNKLNMIVNMRSQDLLKGFPNDLLEFQWFQEALAGWLEIDVGSYYHIVGSLHLYEKDLYLTENLPFGNFYKNDLLVDARLTKEKFWEDIKNLAIYEEEYRKRYYQWDIETLLAYSKKDVCNWNSKFYNYLDRLFLAYNLNKAGEIDKSLELIKGLDFNLAKVMLKRWKV